MPILPLGGDFNPTQPPSGGKPKDPIFWWKVGILLAIAIIAAIGYAITGN
jgi:hypothetical protein